jgi:hypothetical protein
MECDGEYPSLSPQGYPLMHNYGDSVTFYYSAPTGYFIRRVILDGNDSIPVTGSYTLSNIQANHDFAVEMRPNPYISVNAMADVAVNMGSGVQPGHSSPTYTWVCADDWGAYYCHLTDVCVDGVHHNPTDFGTVFGGSVTFNDIIDPHYITITSEPYFYPITFNYYVHNDYYGDAYLYSKTIWRVAWEEVGGPHYSHWNDLHGGGPESTYVDYYVTDPWNGMDDSFWYAYAHNWGGGSESTFYSVPFDLMTFTWGNTVDVWYYGNFSGMESKQGITPMPTENTSHPIYPSDFVPPPSTPYIYDSATHTYVPATLG